MQKANRTRYSPKSGFTLVEVTIAAVVTAFIAMTAASVLRAVTASSEKVGSNLEATAELRFACELLRRDLSNLYRHRNIRDTKLVGTVDPSEYGSCGRITFYTINRLKARFEKPESDVYEVGYFLRRREDTSLLMRRIWPNPDRDAETPGGILSVIAKNIVSLEIKYYDGTEWRDEWAEEETKVPELVDVTMVAELASKKRVVTYSFVVNFVRWPGGENTTAGADAM